MRLHMTFKAVRFGCIAIALLALATSVPAQLRVNVMPGYPNAPKLLPEERRQVRPSVQGGVQNPYFIWGNANGGNGSANGATYTWTFSPNLNLQVVPVSPPLTGTVTNDRFIAEEVVFLLLNNSTRETVTATLTVQLPSGPIAAKSVQIDVISNSDPSLDTQVKKLQVDVNIAIEEGLRWLYLNQNANGSWNGDTAAGSQPCAATGFALWAFENQRHQPTNNLDEDIYAEFVQRGLNWLFASLQVLSGSANTYAPLANVARGATAALTSDLNSNCQVIRCPGSHNGYTTPIVCSAIIASNAPDRVVGITPSCSGGGAVGMTYRSVVEDIIDWIGRSQSTAGSGRGGWDYDPDYYRSRSDMSINSWMYVAMEGASEVFGIDIPDWILQDSEYALAFHQSNNASGQPFGYDNAGLNGQCQQGMATTGGGLSGLVAVETAGPHVVPGIVIAAGPAPLNSTTAKRSSALLYVGNAWNVSYNGSWCSGHFNNFYAMWTLARGLRLTGKATGLPSGQNVQLTSAGVAFDWETGSSDGMNVPGYGLGAGSAIPREGYFNWLVRNQQATGAAGLRGRWYSNVPWLGTNIETACAVLILTPRVFPSPCPSIVNIPIVGLTPPDSSSVPPGTQIVLSGRAVAASPERPILAVLIDGVPSDSLDPTGQFFKTVTINGGINTFTIRAVDACGFSEVLHHVVGGTTVATNFSSLSDVTLSTSIQYSNTTFNQAQNWLVCTAVACNTSSDIIDAPLIMVVDNITQLSVTVQNPDGYTPAGKPYFVFLDPAVNPRLMPGQCTPPKTLVFHNPNHVGVVFQKSWMAQTNRPPFFVSTPPVTAAGGLPYAYQPTAVDPDGDPLSWSLDVAPSGMSIDPGSGSVAWNAPAQLVGAFNIVIRVRDGRGGFALQSYVLGVVPQIPNRPPMFTSGPGTQTSPGAAYAYQATGIDPDQDPLVFSLLNGPPSMTMTPGGVLEWPFAVNGAHPVSIRVDDGRGGFADQSWILAAGTVSPNPQAPAIFGIPPAAGSVGALYFYQPVALNLDPGETLTWSLLTSPLGMQIDSQYGRINWTPGSAQVGNHNVHLVVDDGQGGSCSQAWTVAVTLQPANRPPVVTSTPPTPATLNLPYAYPVAAADPDLDGFTFSLVNPPSGMAIGLNSGLLAWTPSSLGGFVVEIRVTDVHGAVGSQVYFLSVLPPNNAPVITSSPVTSVPVGGHYAYDVNATDPENDPLTYALSTAPAGMTIDAYNGNVLWTPGAAQAGQNGVVVQVDDGRGGTVTQPFAVNVAPDNQAPQLQIEVSPTVPIQINVLTTIRVLASDNVGVVSRSLSIGGTPVSLDVAGRYFATFTTLGPVAFAATAADAAGNVGTTASTVQVVDPNPNPQLQPHVTILSPANFTVITSPTDIVADITAQQVVNMTWEVRIRNRRTNEARTIAQGTGAVSGGVIATVDPTVLPNDSYRGEVEVYNSGPGWIQPFEVAVAGEYKLGNFTYETADLSIPVAGIPLTITRRYDSLDTSSGDFGAGWSLSINVKVHDAPAEGPVAPETFRLGERVNVTRSDGRRVGFRAQAQVISPWFPFAFTPYFVPDAGVTEKLELADPEYVFAYNGFIYQSLFLEPWNPNRFKFTTKEGVVYTISETAGLETVRDANGNTLTIAPQGIISSLGVALTFQRDAAGRITKIIEPPVPGSPSLPGELNYVYDGLGNLVRFYDQLAHETKYLYEDPIYPKYLTRIEDPLNRPVVRNVFDASGRLVAQCDASGNPTTLQGCVAFNWDAVSGVQTIYNARGFRTDLILDSRGNVVIERKWTNGNTTQLDTVRTYDAQDNLLTEADPLNNTSIRTWDAAGNMTSFTDAGGRHWTMTWNAACNKPATMLDPQGNLTSYVYDADCNLRFVTDPLGGVTEYRYDPNGQITDFIDPEGSRWQYGRDPWGLVTSVTDPLGHVATAAYDGAGNIVSYVDRNGAMTNYTYDATHNVITETRPRPTPQTTTFTYSPAGELTSAIGPDGTSILDYWNTGRLRSTTTTDALGGPTVTVTYGRQVLGAPVPGYDGNGNVTHVTDSLGGLTEYVYDELDRLVSVRQSAAPTDSDGSASTVQEKRADLVYDNAGLLRQMRRFSDLAGTAAVANTTYDYDCGNCPQRTTLIDHRRASNNTPIETIALTRDILGNVTSITDNNGLHTYTYDGLRRLLTADHAAGGPLPDEFYTYDRAGNRLSSHRSLTYQYSYQAPFNLGGNQLRQDDQYSYQFDNNGSLIARIAMATGEYTTYYYDGRRRLQRWEIRNSGGSLLHYGSFAYDAFDSRIMSNDSGATIYHVNENGNPVVTLDRSGTVTARRMYSRIVDDILAEDKLGSARWHLTDYVGSVKTLVENSAGILTDYTYDSFGNILAESSQSVANTLRFNAREFNPTLDLGHFRFRDYDPNTGRFTQEDLLEPLRYEFADNSPLVFVDPFGLGVIDYIKSLAPSNTANGTVRVFGRCINKNLLELVLRVFLATQGKELKKLPPVPDRRRTVIECVIEKR